MADAAGEVQEEVTHLLNTWQEFTAGGRPQGGTIPEDLRDFVENVSAKDRPALALFRRSKVNTTFVEWLEDTLASRGFNAFNEGVASTDPPLTTPSRTFTHVQQFAKWGEVSDTQRDVDHKGFMDALMYQEKKKIDELLNDIEHTIHRGSSATGATNAPRQFGGLLNIITTNFTASSGTTMIEEVFNDYVQSFVDGGTDVRPTACFVNSWLKRTISLYNTKVTRNVNASERIQELVIEQHRSDFGDILVYYARDQLKSATKTTQGNSIVILDPSFFETGWLAPLRSEILARDGLRTRFQISAQMTLIFRTQKAGAAATGLVPFITSNTN